MTSHQDQVQPEQGSRRDFLKTSALLAGAAVATLPAASAHAAGGGKEAIRVALIGCGGRGNGAIRDHLEAARYLNDKFGMNLQIQLVAAADWFRGRAIGTGKDHGLAESRCFGGADAYKKALEQKPDIVLMATPPAFRPLHFEAAVKAGKHVFFEKPVAVDPPGVRRVLRVGEEAAKKELSVVAGTQRRHEEGYNRRAAEIKEGLHGRIVNGRVSWCQGGMFTNAPVNPKGPDQLVGPWQIWREMSGDHIVEQHVHNIDIANWFLDAHPLAAVGFGWRAKRVAGNMYDFFSVDFEYPGDVLVHSMCRQVDGCWNSVSEHFAFEKGYRKGRSKKAWADPYAKVGYTRNPYVTEHAHLLYSILKGKPLNEARNVAMSTGTAILGREAAYSGQRITWQEMFEEQHQKPRWYNLQMRPRPEDFETGKVVLPRDGAIRIPGEEYA